MSLIEPEIDPNQNFNAALAAARERQNQQRQEVDQGRDDTGQPDEPAGQGSRRPLIEQISEEAPDQPREPDGRFASPNDPLQRFGSSPTTHDLDEPGTIPPEPEAAPPEETPAETAERLLAGKYKTIEEFEQGYEHLERRLGERDVERDTEAAQLRQQLYDLQQRMSAVAPAATPAYSPPLSDDQIVNGINRDGRDFLAQLYEQEHPSYGDAVDAALLHNPRMAIQWTSDVAAWEAEQRIRSEYDQRFSAQERSIQQVAAPVANAAQATTWNAVWRKLATENPEMTQPGFSEHMLTDLQENQWLTAPLQQGVADAEEKVIDNLLARARNSFRGKVQDARQEQSDEVGREKVAATVATASGGGARPAGDGSEEDARVQRLKDRILLDHSGQNVHEAIHGPVGR